MAQKLEILYLLKVYRLHVQYSNKAQIVYIGSLYNCLEPYQAFFENFCHSAQMNTRPTQIPLILC